MKICCFTGHRPKFFPWHNDLNDNSAKRLLFELRKEILSAVVDGFDTFICGGALGVDTWAAQLVISVKESSPHIRLVIALPFENYNSFVTDTDYVNTINKADKVVIVGTETGKVGLSKRDKFMIDNSKRIIAVYDERTGIQSGTYRALQYAKQKEIEIKQIKWMD